MLLQPNALQHLREEYDAIIELNNFNFLVFDDECELLCNLVNEVEINPNMDVDLNSIYAILFTAASLGLSFSSVLNHIVVGLAVSSYSSNAVSTVFEMHLTYRALLHLAYETNTLNHIQCVVIYSNDKVTVTAVDQPVSIVIDDFFGDRGSEVGALCSLSMSNGAYINTFMNIDEINDIAAMSNNPEWYGVFRNEYIKKQVLKRALTTLPSKLSSRMANANKLYIEHVKNTGSENGCSIKTSTNGQPKTNSREHKKSPLARLNQHVKVNSTDHQQQKAPVTGKPKYFF